MRARRDCAVTREGPSLRDATPRQPLDAPRSSVGDSAAETNRRFHLLLEAGQTGLSVAFDLPTQMGLDSDHPRAEGEVGKTGVAIDSIEDMRRLFDQIPLDLQFLTTSDGVNGWWSMYQ